LIKRFSPSSGFTLFEIIVALFIISLAIIPMMRSFGPAMMAAANVEKTAVLTNQARATMERLLAFDFDTLKLKVDDSQPLTVYDVFGVPTDPADPDYPDYPDDIFEFEGVSYTPEITLADASGDASKTLLDLTVTIGSMRITTKKAAY